MHLWSLESLQWNRKLTKIDNVSNWTICWKLLKFVFCVSVQMCSPCMCSEEDFSVWFCLQSRIPSQSVTQLFLFACSLTRKGASIYYPLVTPLAQLVKTNWGFVTEPRTGFSFLLQPDQMMWFIYLWICSGCNLIGCKGIWVGYPWWYHFQLEEAHC